MSKKHLWEIEHPYMMCEGNYFDNSCHTEYSSWDDFWEDMKDAHDDYNFLFRWDWDAEVERIKLYFVAQRKGFNFSFFVKVKKEDEERIRKYLAKRAKYMKKVWAPFFNLKDKTE